METETDDIVCNVLNETDKAVMLIDEEDRSAWFPKSQINFKRRNMKTGAAIAEIPLWLLEDKGWNE